MKRLARSARLGLVLPVVLLLLDNCSSADDPDTSESAEIEAGSEQVVDATTSDRTTSMTPFSPPATDAAARGDVSIPDGGTDAAPISDSADSSDSTSSDSGASSSDAGPDSAVDASFADVTVADSSAPDASAADASDAALPAPLPVPVLIGADGGLQILHDTVVDGVASDRFTWIDSNGLKRNAVLAHNDDGEVVPDGGIVDAGPDAEPSYGGEMREMDYVVNGATRVVHASDNDFGGFGYVVSHRSDERDGIGGADDSPLGHHFAGTWTRVFEGANHAIFRFSQKYPRYSSTTATPPDTEYDVPVTIDWVFSNGHDAPLWSVTFDLSSVPANALNDDSRAPYGEMLFDGSSSLAAHSLIQGVDWGDRYKFATTTGPVTLGSAWTWNTPNTVPYVDIWTEAVDATMGVVQTQTMAEHEAGGYWGIGRWNTTSAAGNACTIASGGIDSLMPCGYNWPFQTINFQLYDTVTPTNEPRLAWGAEFGALGQTAYYANGSNWYGGPDADHYDSGWPRQSYSTYIVMGSRSSLPVAAQVSHVEAMQTVTSTAKVGSVATSGPAGIDRTDAMTYTPAGYDPIYGALTYLASNNAIDVTFSVASGTLSRPLVIVRDWSAGVPAAVVLDGATLVPGTDAYVSVRPAASELWVTLARDLTGASHRLQIAATP